MSTAPLAYGGSADRPGPLAALALVSDARFPSGSHAHSGSAEGAVSLGWITGAADLRRFLQLRMETVGAVSASLAAASAIWALDLVTDRAMPGELAAGGQHRDRGRTSAVPAWLDAEADARMAAPASRAASRTQGRLLLQAATRVWPGVAPLEALSGGSFGRPSRSRADGDGRHSAPSSPHHAIVLGAASVAAGLGPREAAVSALYGALSGSATAALRLLGLDPIEVTACLASMSADVDAAAAIATASAVAAMESGDGSLLASGSSVELDVAAQRHSRREVKLFAS